MRAKLLSHIEENLLGLILRANRAGIYEQLLQGAGVDIDKALYPVLSATAALGPARVSDIADVLTINPTTTSRHLQALEQKQLVSRSASSTDGRVAMVEVTSQGNAAIRELRAARKRLFAELLNGFETEELVRFEDYLDRLIRAFKDQT